MSTLFPIPPALSKAVPVTYEHQTAVERQRLGGEKRISLASHILRSWGFDYALKGAEAQQARSFFDALKDGPIRLPDWTSPAEVEAGGGASHVITSHEGLDFRCHSVFFIQKNSTEGFEASVTSYDPSTGVLALSESVDLQGEGWQVYPVRVGRLARIPNLPERGDDQVTFSLRFKESIDSLKSGIEWGANDIYPSYKGRSVFSAPWAKGRESWESNISYERKGFGAETSHQREREAKRKLQLTVQQATREEVAGLIKFFDDRRGRAGGFWLSSDRCNFRLALNAQAGDTQITLDADSYESGRVGYDYLNLRCGVTDEFVAVESVSTIAGRVVLTLDAPLSQDLDTDSTAVSLLNYVRFANDRLSLSYESDKHAKAQLVFIELPHEYAAPEAATEPIYLYKIEGYVDELLTSYGVSVTSNGETFLPANINHGPISYRAESLKTSCTVDFAPSTQIHPLNVFLQGYPVEPMAVTIYEIEANNLDVREIVYRGNVRGFDYGAKGAIKIKIGSPGDAAETEIPTAYFEPRCNRRFLAAGCNLSESDYLITGTALTVEGATVTAAEIETEATSRGFPDWFLHGQLKIGTERRAIIRQEGDSVTVSTPFVRAQPGDFIEITPGCNRTQDVCKSRFNNFHNYGGHPFIPPSNPQLEAVRFNATTPQGGKK